MKKSLSLRQNLFNTTRNETKTDRKGRAADEHFLGA